MVVTLKLFAALRELAGEVLSMEVPDGATAGDVKRAVAARMPSAAGLIERSVIAVGHDFVADAAVIPAGVDVALIPPVSGG